MPMQLEAILADMDKVLARYNREEGSSDNFRQSTVTEDAGLMTLLEETIRRYAPRDDYAARAKTIKGSGAIVIQALAGILRTLRGEYAEGILTTIQERVRSEVFSDFLEMAEHLLEDGYKDAAAMYVGGVLEQHLRKLCDKHGVTLPDRATIDPMNQGLAKQNVYGKNEKMQVTAWAAIRNSAAHGDYLKYDVPQVKLMIAGIRGFLDKYPA